MLMVAVAVIVLVPFGVTLLGLNVHVASLGNPEQVNVTALSNAFCGVIVRVLVPLAPGAMVRVVGLAAIPKSGGSGCTTTATAGDVDCAKVPPPPYAAVRDKVPTGRAVVFTAARPDPFSAAVPRTVPPLRKLTLPWGVPAADVTVAVRATLAPETIVVGATASAVVVGSGWIVTVTGAEVEAAKEALPA